MKFKSFATAGLAGAVGLSLLPLVAASAVPAPGAAPTAAAADKCPLSVAHRGGDERTVNANENSMGAFKRAADMGVDVIETDVWFSKDLVPVIMHDKTLDRTTNGTGDVGDYTWKQLQRFRLNNGEKIPSLAEMSAFLKKRDTTGFIEYKDADEPGLYKIYLKELKQSQAKVYGAGFSTDLIDWLHQKDKKLPLMWFGLRSGPIPIPTTPADVPKGADPGLINILQSAAGVADFKAAGLKMNVWFNTLTKGDNPEGTGGPGGVSDGKGWTGLAGFGVHWISTDFPDNYIPWTQSTNACTERAPKKSKSDCTVLPRKLKPGRTYLLKDQGCRTTADKPVAVKVKAKPKVAQVSKRAGATQLVVHKAGGNVRITYKAPKRTFTSDDGDSWTSYQAFRATKAYTVKSRGGSKGLG